MSSFHTDKMLWETNKQSQVVTIVNQINLSPGAQVNCQTLTAKAQAPKTWTTSSSPTTKPRLWKPKLQNPSYESSSWKNKPGLQKLKLQKPKLQAQVEQTEICRSQQVGSNES